MVLSNNVIHVCLPYKIINWVTQNHSCSLAVIYYVIYYEACSLHWCNYRGSLFSAYHKIKDY